MGTTSTALNLRELVRAAAEVADEASPEAIAEIVMAKVDADDYADVIRQILPRYVQVCLHTNLLDNRRSAAQVKASPRRDNMREVLARRLRESVHVGGGAWKFLGDCTFDDLLAAAAERKRQASENIARAKVFEARAKAVRAAGVTTFQQLPTETLQLLLIEEESA